MTTHQNCRPDAAGAVTVGAGVGVGFDPGGLLNGVGVDGGDVEGVVTAGLVTGTVGGEEVEGVGSGYTTGTGGGMVEEGEGMFVEGAVMGVGRGFKEGMVMVGLVEGTVIMAGVGLLEGTVAMGLVS